MQRCLNTTNVAINFVRFAFIFSLYLHICDGQNINFNRDIRPLLSDRCFHCHGPDAEHRKGDLRLDIPDGKDGAYRELKGRWAIVPNHPEKSDLWDRITTKDPDELMPPIDSHKKTFSNQEKKLIKRWIEEGAKYRKFWSFQKLTVNERLIQSLNGNTSFIIDYYIDKELQKKNLNITAKAGKHTLLRRLSLDLTGLPPSYDEVNRFANDIRGNAFELKVNEYLSRKTHGEHMARNWLDLVRFADSDGLQQDQFRNLSDYRDWVIRAYNSNMPYSQFIREQIAGDLIKNPSTSQLIASAYHRTHLVMQKGTMLPEESFYKNVVDRTNAFGTIFLGLTLQCAQCHDHKYDPVSQREYYQLYAFFNNIDGISETNLNQEIQAPFIKINTQEQNLHLEKLEAERKKILSNNITKIIKVNQKELGTQEKLKAIEMSISKIKKQQRKIMVMRERSEVRKTYIMKAGAYDAPGQLVSRGTPSVLPKLITSKKHATRIDLANWLVSPEHPLTARVIVNRLWQQIFGVGLVKTSEDFGAQGDWPSHPELLDFLAYEFINSGWDMRALLKSIVLSKTYQRSSRVSQSAFSQDPENRYLARGSRYRLTPEIMRDQMLFKSGLLNQKMYGDSVKIPQPEGLWKMVSMGHNSLRTFKVDKGDAIYRKSIYTFWRRSLPPPAMTIFNAPSREYCVSRREYTNTPLQALVLMNEPEYWKMSIHCAKKFLNKTEKSISLNNKLAHLYENITLLKAD